MRQLTSLDAQFLAMESERTYGHVSGLAIYDPSTAPGGALTQKEICRLLGERLDQLPPFRWRLAEVPFGIDHPYWVEDPHFDLDFHIRETSAPPPGDPHALAEQVARIVARPLDRKHPLWELYLIHGLPEGRVAMLTKVHHAVVDGVSGAEILSVLLDLSPEGREELPTSKHYDLGDKVPSSWELLGRGLLNLPRQPVRALASLPSAVPNLADLPGVQQLPAWHARQGDDGGAALRVGLARRRGPRPAAGHRPAHALQRADLAAPALLVRLAAARPGQGDQERARHHRQRRRRHARRHGDAHWLLERDELPEDPLVAMVPVSVRSQEQMGTYGNRVGVMITPIPTDVADPRERLLKAHETLAAAKSRHKAVPATCCRTSPSSSRPRSPPRPPG
jgi:hypothetical protein